MRQVSDRPLDSLQRRYRRVQESLAREIEHGRRPPGSPLPPERALAEHFGVSRATMRRALDELAKLGVVERAGNGWGVASATIGEPPNQLMSFTEMATSRGLRPGGRVLDRRVREATIEEADDLRLAPGAPLFELERLRSMDGVPILVDRTCIPLSIAPGIDREIGDDASLYALLEQRYGVRATRARFTIEAMPADPRKAALLSLDEGEPLLRCLQTTEDAGGRAIERCDMAYRFDRYRFHATLRRSN